MTKILVHVYDKENLKFCYFNKILSFGSEKIKVLKYDNNHVYYISMSKLLDVQ